MIKMKSSGSFSNTYKFLRFLHRKEHLKRLDEYGKRGVEALAAATPVDTGKTAASWNYVIKDTANGITITWTNNNNAEGIPIVVLLYYGHATGWGYYVQGRDFITPAIQPIFDEIAESVWKEVTSA